MCQTSQPCWCQARGEQEERELILKRLLLLSGREEHCAAGKKRATWPLRATAEGSLQMCTSGVALQTPGSPAAAVWMLDPAKAVR